jgi:DNA-binding NtrC family response regulator
MNSVETITPAGGSLTVRLNQVEDGKVLLVEDERLVREVTGEVLTAAGYKVLKAENAEHALQLFRKHGAEIALLITDAVLPDSRGPELAMKLIALGGGFRTIVISGYPERMIRRGALGYSYLAKPYSAEAITRKVQQVLNPPR